VQELFDMLNGMHDAALQQAGQLRQRGPEPGPAQQDWLIADQSPRSADPDQEIASVVLASATRIIGRALGRRLQRTGKEWVMPALDARSEQASDEWEQFRREQAAIAGRHPELRGCLRDQVVFPAPARSRV